MIGMPLLYGFFGFIAGTIGALIYNALAGIVGGVKVDLEGVHQEYAPPRRRSSGAPREYSVTESFEVEVERILPGGMGLAHAGGKTVFVSLAAPGDRVRVRVEREQGNVLFAVNRRDRRAVAG